MERAKLGAPTPFVIDVPQDQLDDLARRLALTRYPERETVPDASQGEPLDRVRRLIDYWRDHYDWRRTERRLNQLPQVRMAIDGLDFHIVHCRSHHDDALPLILTHGWPGSFLEFEALIGPLTNPEAYGGHARDAFHVILPSLPGYGFSAKPSAPGWNASRIARAWADMMPRLGYPRYVAQGGDWGAIVTTALGALAPKGLAAIHLNLPLVMPETPPDHPTPDEVQAYAQASRYAGDGAGYFKLQATRPQTIGYALADSPAGQAAWILEKLSSWTDSDDDAIGLLGEDRICDAIMMYWLPNAGASSARMYWENATAAFGGPRIDLPVGVSIFPGELYRPPRIWAERTFPHLIHWNTLPKGGHFAALEQPDLFVQEVRACFESIR